jgi:membrane protein implicated in regulation of membrane protease activity
MLLIGAILLSLFVLPAPWDAVVVVCGAIGEVIETSFGIWYTRRRRALAGAEAMIGSEARVVERCDPRGRVSYRGELWEAHCVDGAEPGERVRIEAIEGLTLQVARLLPGLEREATDLSAGRSG